MESFDVEQIIDKLRVKEKVQLLSLKDFWHTYNVDRLEIPSVRLSDGPNGVRGTKFFRSVPSACFSSGTALAATFNEELLEDLGKLMAKEAHHKGAHVILGPTCNIARGPLGGRGFESFSEDPYLSGIAAAAIINGIQSQGVGATIKHFVCNDIENERNSIDVILSERALREVYLLPFQIAIAKSKPKCVMSSYNKVSGEHVSQSKRLLTDILRKEWGWDGLIMSDWFGVYSIKASLDAGLDLECPGYPLMRKHDAVMHAIASREISMDVIDDRVRNVLKLVKQSIESKIQFNAPEDSKNNTQETSSVIRKAAAEAVILLKNEESILPLQRSDKIAVIGPNAATPRIFGGGSASVNSYYGVSILEGIKSKLEDAPPYSLGCDISRNMNDLGKLSSYDGEPGVWIKSYKEPADYPHRTLLEEFRHEFSNLLLFDYVHKDNDSSLFFLDIEGEFTSPKTNNYKIHLSCLGTALLYIDGKLFIDDKTHQRMGFGAIGAKSRGETKSIKLEKGQTIKYKVEFGSAQTFTLETLDLVGSNGGGSLSLTIGEDISDETRIQEAKEVANSADKVILCVGTSNEWESEGFDRPDMDLPGSQIQLIEEIVSMNKNVVLVNLSGTPVTLPFTDQIPAIVQGWFNGMESGNAIADILYGDTNPSGKLPLTWPKRCEDNPAFLNFHSDKGKVVYGEDVFVGYRYYEKTKNLPLFDFGFGLSYTDFKISNLRVDTDIETLKCTVDVQNVGLVEGAEVVQLYIGSSSNTVGVSRPVKEFKGCKKVFLKPQKSAEVSISVPIKYACSYFDVEHEKWSVEKGDYSVYVGNSSNSSKLLVSKISVAQPFLWAGL
ncbi:hypothetical protein OGAPHI_001701 [Ogataea philodendri]|uniref:beta-glucosidase n=1 Tax=Ogataea philodendri TaxID=1378263 RepID=A0A9P8PAU0_9ASCO|nr:uncharacterized protein OGAPHI_001701 [Ogataea philodendri]KAH3667947.1 hypothetical protein OGAPHI_001701 [Ogataea philodendri]